MINSLNTITDEITIDITTLAEELKQVYELRYKLFSNGISEQITQLSGQLKDEYDNDKALIVIAKNQIEEVVGSLRLTFRRDGKLQYDWCCDYDFIAEYTCLNKDEVHRRCALISRVVVHEQYRRKQLYWKMHDFALQLAMQKDCNILIETWLEEYHFFAMAHERRSWILPEKQYLNSKGLPYYFGFKILE